MSRSAGSSTKSAIIAMPRIAAVMIPKYNLSRYADQKVQVAFYFSSTNNSGISGSDVSTGWYIDDIEIISDPVIMNNPEDWESGIGDWASESGTWEVGTPASGPGSAYQGNVCAATVLGDNYASTVSSRLISPKFTITSVSENPSLRFWHWYSFSYSDYGEIQIKLNDGEWNPVSNQFTNTSSGVWTPFYLSLSPYVDSLIQIAFYFKAQNNSGISGDDVSSGWYVDDVVIDGLTTKIEDFINSNQYIINQNYPNPFTHQTIIEYSIPEDTKVWLYIYSMNGELITTLVNGEVQNGGIHTVLWNGTNNRNKKMVSGTYIYELITDRGVITRTMIMTKQ